MAAQSHAGASQQHPTTETSCLCSSGVWAWGARLYPHQTQEMGPPCPLWPCCHQGRAGWVNAPPLPGPCSGWDNHSPRMMPEADHFAGSFIQAEFAGKGDAGSQAYDQVSDWKRWDRSRAAKCSSASEGDRPPSSCNTDCRASATAAGICLAFLEERVGGMMEGEQGNWGHACIPSAPARQPISGAAVPAAKPSSAGIQHGLPLHQCRGNPPHSAMQAAWH